MDKRELLRKLLMDNDIVKKLYTGEQKKVYDKLSDTLFHEFGEDITKIAFLHGLFTSDSKDIDLVIFTLGVIGQLIADNRLTLVRRDKPVKEGG